MMKDGPITDWENKNARYVAKEFRLHFKRCPRRFLKTDVPAKAPRRDCPFRATHIRGRDEDECILPSGFRYLSKKIGATGFAPCIKLICYLENEGTSTTITQKTVAWEVTSDVRVD